ncbi:MAG: hypothetical protein JWQ57_4062 [Mucilaginibacter sp.]|nr:hypothetical protein [Mucilaginibacter sp.]
MKIVFVVKILNFYNKFLLIIDFRPILIDLNVI